MTKAPQTERLLIVGAAPFAVAALPPDVAALPKIAVDGGIAAAPDAIMWVGDGDSGHQPQDMPVGFKDDQSKTDLAYMLEIIRNWDWRELHLAGFWGGRFDHALAVLGTLQAEMHLRPNIRQFTLYNPLGDVGAVMLPQGRHDVAVEEKSFSVLCLEPVTFSLSGAVGYAAENLPLAPLSGRAISNKGQGIVHLQTDGPLLIVFP